MIDDLSVEVPPARYMLIVRNDDVPGMIATVASALATANINIADMHLGRSPEGAESMQVIETNQTEHDDAVQTLRAAPGILSVHAIATD